ncbi:MAG: hypothetical protein RL014_1112 [Pseudomonadota bacterium]|jgi:hypothetical protein
MSIQYTQDQAALEGVVVVEEAESLQNRLKEQPETAVNLSMCESMHASVLQVLLALRPPLQGQPSDPWIARILERDAAPGRSPT